MNTYEVQTHGSPDQAIRVNDSLKDFYKIFTPSCQELQHLLKESLGKNVLELTPSALYIPPLNLFEKSDGEISNKTIRIRTSSEKKWTITAGILLYEGFAPLRDIPTEDEENYHTLIRKWDKKFPQWYPVRIANLKQSTDVYPSPLITLDTVSYADGELIEKPHTLEEAKELMNKINGKRVTTDTGWVLGMRLQSGASVRLQNSTRLSYTIKSLLPQEIDHHLKTTPNIFDVTAAMDLSTASVRGRFVDMRTAVTLEAFNSFGYTDTLTLPGNDLYLSLFNPLFAGVPVHAIQALLPSLEEIYLQGDPFSKMDNSD
jgi:predicted house-cleaning NTP pyrophosphatase (Maf/HAM1 superfamily)